MAVAGMDNTLDGHLVVPSAAVCFATWHDLGSLSVLMVMSL